MLETDWSRVRRRIHPKASAPGTLMWTICSETVGRTNTLLAGASHEKKLCIWDVYGWQHGGKHGRQQVMGFRPSWGR